MTNIIAIEQLIEHAQNYKDKAVSSISRNNHMNDLKEDIPQKHVDAVLVDFINYIAGKYCMDLGLYTIDLYKEK